MTPCPHAPACWLSGNYNYCKVSHCHEPLLPKDKQVLHDRLEKDRRRMDRTEAMVERIYDDIVQGELF